ncbi:recombinase family protein [Burkholderia stagnalis]|uniref:recombinase family protein n=1 Tax=Burkholderia stagnalis TaxID=1503054 RepID=UPI0012D9E957
MNPGASSPVLPRRRQREREQQKQQAVRSYPHRNRCTTLSRGGADLDENGGSRFGGNQHAALAEFERALIAERTRAGMSAARQRGQRIGRPPALTPDQVAVARQMIHGHSMEEVADHFDVHAVTIRRYLQQPIG